MVKAAAPLLTVTVCVTMSTTIVFGERLIKFANNNNEFGKYSFEFETSGGTFRREDGGLTGGVEGDSLIVRGEYGYIDPAGRHIVVSYIADTNGYRTLPVNYDVRFNDRRIV